MPKARLLYVEDDESLSFVTRDNLELQGYDICYCADGREAMNAIWNENFDLCILDVMLPYVDGFSLAQEIRKKSADVPIIFLTAKSLKEDKLHGLKLGGDDYLTKPFSIEELILKVEIFLKRSRISYPDKATEQVVFSLGKYHFDYKNLSLTLDADPPKTMTQKEADLLKLLIENKNEVIKRSTILKALWGEDDYFMGRSMDVFISRLRKYLADDVRIKLENIHGVGFKLKL